MYKVLLNRYQQGQRTSKFPKEEIILPAIYRGRPQLSALEQLGETKKSTDECIKSCPFSALALDGKERPSLNLDMGKCVFCGECEKNSGGELVRFTNDFKMGADQRDKLIVTSASSTHSKKSTHGDSTNGNELNDFLQARSRELKKMFSRSLQLRQVSAGGCNACEADINVLNTPFFDLARFGIQIVASPRHADGLLVTGPVSKNMKEALLKSYHAVPAPKMVIAVGSCAIAGGPFHASDEVLGGVMQLLPVDLFIPGCPPHPLTTLFAILNYFGIL
ncbi:MAG: hydrogenase [Oligoflexia bacterium]|nr:hydrogenase [Oligoflexia bacterium]